MLCFLQNNPWRAGLVVVSREDDVGSCSKAKSTLSLPLYQLLRAIAGIA
jgi:hypothetical protein